MKERSTGSIVSPLSRIDSFITIPSLYDHKAHVYMINKVYIARSRSIARPPFLSCASWRVGIHDVIERQLGRGHSGAGVRVAHVSFQSQEGLTCSLHYLHARVACIHAGGNTAKGACRRSTVWRERRTPLLLIRREIIFLFFFRQERTPCLCFTGDGVQSLWIEITIIRSTIQ